MTCRRFAWIQITPNAPTNYTKCTNKYSVSTQRKHGR